MKKLCQQIERYAKCGEAVKPAHAPMAAHGFYCERCCICNPVHPIPAVPATFISPAVVFDRLSRKRWDNSNGCA